MSSKEILVVGGGIGGLACAIALKKAGFSPLVFEKRKDIDQIGGALVLRPHATKVLDQLGVLPNLIHYSEILKLTSVKNSKGKLLKRWDLPQMETPTIFCRRSDLLRCLYEEAQKNDIAIRLDSTFIKFEQHSGEVLAHFHNQDARGSALIGADGIWSRVRAQLLGNEAPRFRGYIEWRHLTQNAAPFVLPGEKTEWWGASVRFGVSRIGTGTQWCVSLASMDPDWKSDGDTKDFFQSIFSGWDEPIQELIKDMSAGSLVRNAIYDRPYTEKWGEGSVTLLGDSAHPVTPDLGLGAGIAIMDAAQLTDSLTHSSPLQNGLREYEQSRRGIARSISNESGFIGQVAHWSNPWLVKLRDQLILRCPKKVWNRRISRTYSRELS